jgi:hypothetical protein
MGREKEFLYALRERRIYERRVFEVGVGASSCR